MTDDAGGPISRDHPVLLPWYVSGVLDEEEKRRVTRHLEDCSSCRHEVRALSGVQATLRRQARSDHVTVVDLVTYEEWGVAPDSPRGQMIHAHLADCELCRSDLEASRRSREILKSLEDGAVDSSQPAAPRPAGSRYLAMILAATVALALGLPAWLWLRTSTPPPRDAAEGKTATDPHGAARRAGTESQSAGTIVTSTPIRPVQGITMMPARRDGTLKIVVHGEGPWGVTVVLPFGAPAGVYDIRIETRHGALVDGLTTHLDSRGEDRLMFLLDRDLPEGTYRLIATPAGASASPYVFEFERQKAVSVQDDPGRAR